MKKSQAWCCREKRVQYLGSLALLLFVKVFATGRVHSAEGGKLRNPLSRPCENSAPSHHATCWLQYTFLLKAYDFKISSMIEGVTLEISF